MTTISQKHSDNSAITLIEAKTGAENSSSFQVPDKEHVTVFCDTPGSSEEITLQVQRPDGTFINALDGTFPLKSTKTITAVYGKGIYRVVKPVTAASVGVYLFIQNFDKN